MALQLFGTKKCAETRKAERWLKERDIPFQFRDINEKPPSPGELDSIAKAAGGYPALIDENSKAFRDAGLAYMEYDAREKLLEKPLVMRIPVLRDGPKAVAGFDPPAYSAFTSS